MRRTKLVCTIGPASAARLDELLMAGMDVARLNFSHGTAEGHRATLARLRDVATAAGRSLAVIADLPGPKVRLLALPGGERQLAEEEELRLGGPDAFGGTGTIATTYPGLADDVQAGDRLLLADGAVELTVLDAGGGTARTRVLRGGLVRSGAGVNVPSERLRLPAITDRDRAALAAVLEMGVDYVAQSFVRSAADVRDLRALMGERSVPIIAKVETRAATAHLDEILGAADAVMLARGDLGVELPFEEVPILQKRIIAACVAGGVPIVVATQMLESMVHAPRPTRAEASDVANAVLDGADAVMLSAETAIGDHPVLAARAAASIATAIEAADPAPAAMAGSGPPGSEADAIARAAVDLARSATDPEVSGIACFTRSGLTARLLAARRPRCPIYAISPDAGVVRRMALWRGVVPMQAEAPGSTDEMIHLANGTLRAAGLPSGGRVVIVASIPFGAARTNFLKLHRLEG